MYLGFCYVTEENVKMGEDFQVGQTDRFEG